MKKLTAIIAAFVLLISTSAFANTGIGIDNVSKTVKEAFEKNFSGAQQVSWSKLITFTSLHSTIMRKK